MLAKIAKGLLIGCFVIGMAGCAKHAGSGYDKTRVGNINDAVEFYGENVSPSEERDLLNTNTLYFAYDSYEVSPHNRLVILAHAKKLIQNPNFKMRVEGHTDERGSREYNIALGERRAKAVVSILEEKGIGDHRLAIVSYGKEKPVSLGHGESSWNKNRRAVMDYEG